MPSADWKLECVCCTVYRGLLTSLAGAYRRPFGTLTYPYRVLNSACCFADAAENVLDSCFLGYTLAPNGTVPQLDVLGSRRENGEKESGLKKGSKPGEKRLEIAHTDC